MEVPPERFADSALTGFTVALMFVFSPMVTSSTGTTGGVSSEIFSVCCQVKNADAMMSACNSADPARPAGVTSWRMLAALILLLVAGFADIGYEPDMGEACCVQ